MTEEYHKLTGIWSMVCFLTYLSKQILNFARFYTA